MNNATRTNVAVLGTIFGISGMSHGFFETLQGNVPTDGLFIFAIGAAQKMWPHGDEPAFTLIPNFLLTGIAAMIVGLGPGMLLPFAIAVSMSSAQSDAAVLAVSISVVLIMLASQTPPSYWLV